MWLHLLVLVFASALALGQSSASKPVGGQVEGTVVSAINGQLVPRAMVMVRKGSKDAPATLGRADDNAHFVIDHLEPGSYVISAAKQGYFTDEHKLGQQATLDLTAGGQVKDIVVRLMPLGVITGRVVDEANDPIHGAEVRLLAVEYYRGRESMHLVGAATSDDRGEYRIFDVRPGSYFLLVEHNLNKEWRKATGTLPPKGSWLDVIHPLIFYPASTDVLQAQKMTVNAGDMLNADFALFPVQAVSIQGRVVNGMTNRPISHPSVTAYWGESASMMARIAEISDDGREFEVRGLGPGTYTLQTKFTDDNESFSDERVVEIGSQGMKNLVIAGLPDFEITGHVRMENARYGAFTPSVEFASVGPKIGSIFRVGTNRPDYRFAGKLHPGDHYKVNVPNLPQDFYLKSVRVAGREVPNTEVSIGGRNSEIDLLLSPAGGHIEGTTLNDKHEPVSSSYVFLVPDFSDKINADLIRPTRSDLKGKFVIRGVPPGNYKLFAFEDVELNEMLNQPELLKNYDQSSQSVKVEEAGKYTVELKPVATTQ